MGAEQALSVHHLVRRELEEATAHVGIAIATSSSHSHLLLVLGMVEKLEAELAPEVRK